MVRIVTDSAASIPYEQAAARDIEVVSLFLRFDGGEHLESDMDVDAFYGTLAERIDDIPTSSQPSQHVFERLFEDAAAAGDSVLGIFMSSRLSGTLDGALRAARAVRSHNIDFRFVLIDSSSAASDEAFAVLDAADARDAGGTLEECAAAAQHAALSSRILFAPESLKFLRAGGRIGAASALLGGLIQIVPILTVVDGEVSAAAKIRSQKRAVEAMIETFKNDAAACGLKRAVIHYIGRRSKWTDRLCEAVSQVAGHAVAVRPVSPVIGSHVGPAVGVAYECLDYLENKFGRDSGELVLTA